MKELKALQKPKNDQQTKVIEAVIFEGLSLEKAAKKAGYTHSGAWALFRRPAFLSLLRQERQKAYALDLAPRAIQTLRDVMSDPDASAAARVTAARTALEVSGDLARAQEEASAGRKLSELSGEQLSGMLENMAGERAQLQADLDRARNSITVIKSQ